MSDDEYEILPHEEIEHLRKEVHELKQNPLKGFGKSHDLIESIDRLSISIDRLLRLFETADKALYNEYHKGYHEQSDHLNRIEEQNKKIAKGLVALSKIEQHDEELDEETLGMVKKQQKFSAKPLPSMSPPKMPPSSLPPIQESTTPKPLPRTDVPLEPPPPKPAPKKGLFGK